MPNVAKNTIRFIISIVHIAGGVSANKYMYRIYRWWLLNTYSGRRKLLYHLTTRKERKYPSCLECGACCKHCPAYSHISNKCRIWEEAKRVFHCDNYPLCPQALEKDGLVGVCRYYWNNR